MNEARQPVAAARRQYSIAFRREVVRLVREDRVPLEDLGRVLHLKVRTLQRWVSAEREPSAVDSGWREFATNPAGRPGAPAGSERTSGRELPTESTRRR